MKRAIFAMVAVSAIFLTGYQVLSMDDEKQNKSADTMPSSKNPGGSFLPEAVSGAPNRILRKSTALSTPFPVTRAGM